MTDPDVGTPHDSGDDEPQVFTGTDPAAGVGIPDDFGADIGVPVPE